MHKSTLSISMLALALASLVSAQYARADTCNGVSANLVSNCGFETGTFTGWSGTSTTDLNSGIDVSDLFTTAKTPFNGTYEAYLGSVGVNDVLTQILTTIPGFTYIVEFALLNDTAVSTGYPNFFSASFGGTTIFSETNAAAGSYQLYVARALATSTATPLTFTSQNNLGSFELDSASVAATPEPSSLLLLGTGLVGAFAIARRRIAF